MVSLERLRFQRNFMRPIHTRFFKGAASLFLVISFAAALSIPGVAQTHRRTYTSSRAVSQKRSNEPRYFTVPANEVLRVRINQQIDSGSSRVGDIFTTTVIDPVFSRGAEVIPAGSVISGRITNVNRASRGSHAGSMGVIFYALRLPSGYSRAINGSLTSLNTDSAKADNESGVSGRSASQRNVVFVGGGAASGALIGAIAGGGKGAGIGAGVGAGIGAAGALFARGKEATVRRGTEFGVVLNQSVTLPETAAR
jgi:hypothetical protein